MLPSAIDALMASRRTAATELPQQCKDRLEGSPYRQVPTRCSSSVGSHLLPGVLERATCSRPRSYLVRVEIMPTVG